MRTKMTPRNPLGIPHETERFVICPPFFCFGHVSTCFCLRAQHACVGSAQRCATGYRGRLCTYVFLSHVVFFPRYVPCSCDAVNVRVVWFRSPDMSARLVLQKQRTMHACFSRCWEALWCCLLCRRSLTTTPLRLRASRVAFSRSCSPISRLAKFCSLCFCSRSSFQ